MSLFNGVSFGGILRYLVYAVVGGWMFFLGILVGRGTSPVTFDTKSFHNRLDAIVQSYGKTEPEKKMDLQFYDALNNPVQHEVTGKKNTPNEIVPKKEGRLVIQVPIVEGVPVKTSLKTATLNKAAFDKAQFNKAPPAKTPVKKEKQMPVTDAAVSEKKLRKVPLKQEPIKKVNEKAPPKSEAQAGVAVAQGVYTIQVAAFKSFTDAVSQMALLEKKGFSSYRTLGKKEGVTWYRVRVGSFATREAAALYIEKLKHAKIQAMIIKKE